MGKIKNNNNTNNYTKVHIWNWDSEYIDTLIKKTKLTKSKILHKAIELLQEDYDNKKPKILLMKDYLLNAYQSQIELRKNIEEVSKKIDMLISAVNKNNGK